MGTTVGSFSQNRKDGLVQFFLNDESSELRAAGVQGVWKHGFLQAGKVRMLSVA